MSQYMSPTTLTSGQPELEPSLSTPLLYSLEASEMFTPALPSELFSGQLETDVVFTSLIPVLQTFSISSLHDVGDFSSQQQTLGSQDSFNENEQALSLGNVTWLPTHLSLSPSSSNPQIISVPTLSFKSSQGTVQIRSSVELTQTRYLEKTQTFSHISLVSTVMTSAFLMKTLLDILPPVLKTVAHELYTTSSGPDLSFPLCDESVARDASGCTSTIKGTLSEYLSLRPSGNVLEQHSESNKFASLLLGSTEEMPASEASQINHVTSRRQIDNSEGDVLSTVTNPSSTNFNGNSGKPIAGQLPTQQFLSMSTSPLLALDLTSYQDPSSVQPSCPSASTSGSLNLPPKVAQPIPALTATVGFPFHYSIPPRTFVDPEDGEADALSLEMQLTDGPPDGVGTWLALDSLELHGVPLEVDLQFAPQDLLLVARDRHGLSARLPLTLDLSRSPVDPCHVFTLTAQRSLHSMLRRRRRVELLLRKLAGFFNGSSGRHLSIVSVTPGSTVVSWYNYSLCETQIRTTRCHADQIRRMWLAMSSADGSVNLAFREAMLPEFPISRVGSVIFSSDCFPTTPTVSSSTQSTLNPGLGTNSSLSPTSETCVPASPAPSTTSKRVDPYQRTADMLTALLIVCLLILVVLLVSAVLYFCRGLRRPRTVAIWPARSTVAVQCRDLSAIRPRRPPLLHPELPPPPLSPWFNNPLPDELPSDCKPKGKTLKILQSRPQQYDFFK
ncbi:dystroglycan 1-like [Mugil cephalus]|uniref:dystroglycan 1-like n=1 Tax=Mugil cephalus TaxID=48193 RepID=UPI001FB7CBE6|nr:dystroglycan 1-like [Mugil cephalus]